MKYLILIMILLLTACTPSWTDGPYEIYIIDGEKNLGYNLGEGAYIRRIDEPRYVNANDSFVAVYACPKQSCAYYYIDRQKDYKFAEANEFVFGPFAKDEFYELTKSLNLPHLQDE